MKCHNCQGTGQTITFGCPGFRRMTTTCSTCQGSGELSEVRRQELASAEQLRQYRLGLGLSGSQFAAARGLDHIALNHMECGRQAISAELLEELVGKENR
jgi:hypothetical protein